jgi:hypothetical protein
MSSGLLVVDSLDWHAGWLPLVKTTDGFRRLHRVPFESLLLPVAAVLYTKTSGLSTKTRKPITVSYPV